MGLFSFHLAEFSQDFLLIRRDPLLHRVVHLQRLLQAEDMIFPPVSAQLFRNFLLGFAATSVAQLRQFLRITFASGDGAQDGHSRHSIDVGNRSVYAHVYLVKTLLHPPYTKPTATSTIARHSGLS